ncbi:MAG: energy transducer TonB [Bacteroidetes bacterium]|nr:MAG: energy transducer TonB [Bacteroidota bacterium]
MKHFFITLSIVIAFFFNFSCKDNAGPAESTIVQATEPDINAFIAVDEYPVPTNQVNPAYPENALKNKIMGTVYVKALLTTEGKVKKAVVIERKEGSPDLETAALMATYQWTFTPAKKNGSPVELWVMIPFRFAMSEK